MYNKNILYIYILLYSPSISCTDWMVTVSFRVWIITRCTSRLYEAHFSEPYRTTIIMRIYVNNWMYVNFKYICMYAYILAYTCIQFALFQFLLCLGTIQRKVVCLLGYSRCLIRINLDKLHFPSADFSPNLTDSSNTEGLHWSDGVSYPFQKKYTYTYIYIHTLHYITQHNTTQHNIT